MSYYANSEQLIRHLQSLFERIGSTESDATRAVSNSRLIIRLNLLRPQAQILINGRHNPVQVTYGPSKLRPDLDISLPADTLHNILLKELSLKQALASGQMQVRGPIFKTFALEDIFRRGQEIYPQILHEQGQGGIPPKMAG